MADIVYKYFSIRLKRIIIHFCYELRNNIIVYAQSKHIHKGWVEFDEFDTGMDYLSPENKLTLKQIKEFSQSEDCELIVKEMPPQSETGYRCKLRDEVLNFIIKCDREEYWNLSE